MFQSYYHISFFTSFVNISMSLDNLLRGRNSYYSHYAILPIFPQNHVLYAFFI